MASNITEEDTISEVDVQRWQKLFGFTYSGAFATLEGYREDFTRVRMVDALWDAVKSEKQAERHNRESYEYSLTQPQKRDLSRTQEETGTFIVQLAGPVNTPQIIQEAAALTKLPAVVDSVGENGQAQFCEINGAAKNRLLSWVAKHHCGFQPTIVRLSKAKKELCTHAYPSTSARKRLHAPSTPSG